MRRFVLDRSADISGVSGVGVVAGGVVFSSGKAVLCWFVEPSSVAVYDSMDDLITIHGHDGDTQLVWIDASEA